MVMIQGRHSTTSDRRDSILKRGLEARKPTEDGNYVDVAHDDFWQRQPRGVYLSTPDISLRGPNAPGWAAKLHEDVWLVTFTGPIAHDPVIDGAIVSLAPIPPEWIVLEKRALSPPFGTREATPATRR